MTVRLMHIDLDTSVVESLLL